MKRGTKLVIVAIVVCIAVPTATIFYVRYKSFSQWAEIYSQSLILHKQGRYAEAANLANDVLIVVEKTPGINDRVVAGVVNNLAIQYYAQGKYNKAEPLYRRAIEIMESATNLGIWHPDIPVYQNNLANLYYAQGKHTNNELLIMQSLETAQWALGAAEKTIGANSLVVAECLESISYAHIALGNRNEARPLIKRALEIRAQTLDHDPLDTVNSLNEIARLYILAGNFSDAIPLIKQSLNEAKKGLNPDHPDMARSLYNLALLYDYQGKYAEAEPLYHRALEIWEKALGNDHPYVANILQAMVRHYKKMRKEDEVVSIKERLRKFSPKYRNNK